MPHNILSTLHTLTHLILKQPHEVCLHSMDEETRRIVTLQAPRQYAMEPGFGPKQNGFRDNSQLII